MKVINQILFRIISQLPRNWKWVRKSLGGKWKCFYWMHEYSGSETTYFWLKEPIDNRDQLWTNKIKFDEDYTIIATPMLPKPTNLTGYRG